MNPLLVLVIAAQIGTAQPDKVSDEDKRGLWLIANCAADNWKGSKPWKGVPLPCSLVREAFLADPKTRPIIEAMDGVDTTLPISTRRVEPLVVEPERAARFTRVVPSEPPIVPAVQQAVKCFDGKGAPISCWGTCPNNPSCLREETKPYWTCKDKRRVLLTAENGTRHCVLFEGAR